MRRQFGGHQNPDLIREASERFGSQCIVVAIDARSNGKGGWEVYAKGGREPTGLDVVEWARKCRIWEPAKSCSPAWTVTAPAQVSIWICFVPSAAQ